MARQFQYNKEGGISVDLKGLDSLKESLRQLTDDTKKKVSIKALRVSAEDVKAQAVANCPKRLGLLARSIRLARIGKRDLGNDMSEGIKVVAGDWRAWYAGLVEFGFTHSARLPKALNPGGRRKSRPTSRGFVEGKAFLRNAAESKFNSIIETFASELAKGVDKAIKKK